MFFSREQFVNRWEHTGRAVAFFSHVTDSLAPWPGHRCQRVRRLEPVLRLQLGLGLISAEFLFSGLV